VVETGSLTYYGAGDTRIVYENGAVFRMQGDNGVMLNEPDLLLGDTVVYSLHGLGGSSQTAGGDRTVLVIGQRDAREAAIDDRTATDNVTLAINSSQATVWERYYSEQEHVSVSTTGGPDLTVTFDADHYERFVVHRTETLIEFSD
jgi:hypothetical protein